MVTSVDVLGRSLSFPIPVVAASVSGAVLAAPVATVTDLVARGPQSEVFRIPGIRPLAMRGRTLVTVLHVCYDEDPGNVLGAYHEFGLGFPMRIPGRGVLQHVHELPVDQDFTLSAGRQLWGYPKWRAEMTGRAGSPVDPFTLSLGGTEVLRAVFDAGRMPALPAALPLGMDSVQVLDGRPVRVRARATVSGVRFRPGGFRLTSGEVDGGDGARLLCAVRALELDTARALGTFAFGSFRAEFAEPQEL